MYTSLQLLDMVKARHRLPSDYAAAKVIGLSKQSLSRIRAGIHTFGPEGCIKVAKLLEIEPLRVIASARIEQLEKLNDKDHINLWKEFAA